MVLYEERVVRHAHHKFNETEVIIEEGGKNKSYNKTLVQTIV